MFTKISLFMMMLFFGCVLPGNSVAPAVVKPKQEAKLNVLNVHDIKLLPAQQDFVTVSAVADDVSVRLLPPMSACFPGIGDYTETYEITNNGSQQANVLIGIDHSFKYFQAQHFQQLALNEEKQIRHAETLVTVAKGETITTSVSVPMPSSVPHWRNLPEQTVYNQWKLIRQISINGKPQMLKKDDGDAPSLQSEHSVTNIVTRNNEYHFVSQKANRQNLDKELNGMLLASVPVADWSRRTADYLPYRAVWINNGETVSEPVNQALMGYVRMGGALVLTGTSSSSTTIEKMGLGRIYRSPDNQPKTVQRLLQDIARFQQAQTIADVQLERERPPFKLYGVLALVAIVVLGPGIWLLLSWRKAPLAGLVVTPLVSVIASIVVLAVYMCHEGFTPTGKIDGIAFYDQIAQTLSMHSKMEVYVPFFAPSLKLNHGDSLRVSNDIYPQMSETTSNLTVKDVVVSRKPCRFELFQQRSTAGEKLGTLDITPDGNGYRTTNNLGVPLTRIIVRGDDGRFYGFFADRQDKNSFPTETTKTLEPMNIHHELGSALEPGQYLVTLFDVPFGVKAGLDVNWSCQQQTIIGRWK